MYTLLSDKELLEKHGDLLRNKALTAVSRQTLPQEEAEPTDDAKVFACAQRNMRSLTEGIVAVLKDPLFA